MTIRSFRFARDDVDGFTRIDAPGSQEIIPDISYGMMEPISMERGYQRFHRDAKAFARKMPFPKRGVCFILIFS